MKTKVLLAIISIALAIALLIVGTAASPDFTCCVLLIVTSITTNVILICAAGSLGVTWLTFCRKSTIQTPAKRIIIPPVICICVLLLRHYTLDLVSTNIWTLLFFNIGIILCTVGAFKLMNVECKGD